MKEKEKHNFYDRQTERKSKKWLNKCSKKPKCAACAPKTSKWANSDSTSQLAPAWTTSVKSATRSFLRQIGSSTKKTNIQTSPMFHATSVICSQPKMFKLLQDIRKMNAQKDLLWLLSWIMLSKLTASLSQPYNNSKRVIVVLVAVYKSASTVRWSSLRRLCRTTSRTVAPKQKSVQSASRLCNRGWCKHTKTQESVPTSC